MAHRLSDPHPSPLLATASKALCKAQFPGSKRVSVLRARPRSLPKRAHPARQAHQPLGPGTASRPQAVQRGRSFGDRAESTLASQRASQRSQHPHRFHQRPPSGVQPHGRTPSRPPQRPSSLSAGQRPARLSLPRSQRPSQPAVHSHIGRRMPPSCSPQTDTLGVLLHFISAHPPCSRKGPLLPACGPKSPRRVKRETTNSRFSFQRDFAKIPVDSAAPNQKHQDRAPPPELVGAPPLRFGPRPNSNRTRAPPTHHL